MLFRRCQLFVGAFSRLRDYDGIVLIYNPHWHVAQAFAGSILLSRLFGLFSFGYVMIEPQAYNLW